MAEMSERYIKTPRVNVKDRARLFEAKQSTEPTAKGVSSSSTPAGRRLSSTPPKPSKDADEVKGSINNTPLATTTTTTTTTTSSSLPSHDDAKKSELNNVVTAKDNSVSCTAEVVNRKKIITNNASSSNDNTVIIKKDDAAETSTTTTAAANAKIIRRDKNSGAKKKVSTKVKESGQDSAEIPASKKKVDATKNNQQQSFTTSSAGEQPPLTPASTSDQNDPVNGGQANKVVAAVVVEVVDTEATTTTGIIDNRKQASDDVKLDGKDELNEIIPEKNTKELVKQFNKLSAAQLEVLHKKSCSLDSGLSEITNRVNEEENDTSDDSRATFCNSQNKSSSSGAKFRKFRNGGIVKKPQPTSKQKNLEFSKNDEKTNSNRTRNEDKCVEAVNRDDSHGEFESLEEACQSPPVNQRSTSYLRYLQRITQLQQQQQQQQKNIKDDDLQQLVNENFNVYGSLNRNGEGQREANNNSLGVILRYYDAENVHKDDLRDVNAIENKKRRTKITSNENSSNSLNRSGNCGSTTPIELKKNSDECFCGKIANSKLVAASMISNSLSNDGEKNGGETVLSNSFTYAQPDQAVVKRDGSSRLVANSSPITSALAHNYYLSSSPTVAAAAVGTNATKQDVWDEENKYGEDDDDEEEEDKDAATESKFSPSMFPSQNKWKIRANQSKTPEQQQQQLLTPTTLLNPFEHHQHKQAELNFQSFVAPEWKNEKEGGKKIARPGTKVENELNGSYYTTGSAGEWNPNPDYDEESVNESTQIAELLTSVRKIREEFEKCSFEVEQEVKDGQTKEKEEREKEENHLLARKNYALNDLTLAKNKNKSEKFMDISISDLKDRKTLLLENENARAYGLKDEDERVKLLKNNSQSSLPSACNNKSFSKTSSDDYDDYGKVNDNNLSITLNKFGYAIGRKSNERLSRINNTDNVDKSGENFSKLSSSKLLVDDSNRMERKNNPGSTRFLNENIKSPISPLNLPYFETSANCSSPISNGIVLSPNSPRSILTNKSTSQNNSPQTQFNYSNLNNNRQYSPSHNQQHQLFQSKSISPTKSQIQVRSKPELPSYFTFRRHPGLRKLHSDSSYYDSGAVSDGEKGELEKIESILGELDFSKYKRGSGSNRQPNQSLHEQQLPASSSCTQQKPRCNYSLVPISVPRRSLSHQTSSKSHHEKLKELRELTDKLKPTLNKVKLDSNTSSSSSSSANSPYLNSFSPNIDGWGASKSQSLPRRNNLLVYRSASVPQVDEFDDLEEQINLERKNNANCLHKSYSSSEYIPENISPLSSSKVSPQFFATYKSTDKNRLNTLATLPRNLRGGLFKMDKSDEIADFGDDNWDSQFRHVPDDVIRRMPIDCSTDEGLVADSEVASDYMQAYRNVTSSFSAPSTPVTRHRVIPTSVNNADRFDLQVEAAIAELQATTSASYNSNNTPFSNADALQYNSLDRRKRRKGAGLNVGFNTVANEVTAKSGNGRSLTYPPQRRTSVTEGMEFTSMDSNGIPSYVTANSMINADLSGILKGGSGRAGNKNCYNLHVAEDVGDFPSELSLADSHLCPSEISYETTYNDVLESVTAESNELGINNKNNGGGKPLKKKHYSDPSGEKNNDGLALDLPEFISCAKSEPQLPSNKKSDNAENYGDEHALRSRQSYNSLIPQYHNSVGLTRSTSLSPSVTDNSEENHININSLGNINDGSSSNGGSEVNLERSDSKSPQQQRRYSKKRLRGPYGEMLEEEMRKSGEKHSQKVIAEELNFLQELLETRPSTNDGVSSTASIEPLHSRHHMSSQSLDENALRSNSAVLDIYNNQRSGGNGDRVGGANSETNELFTSSVPTLRLKDLCERIDGDEDVESLLKKHQVGLKIPLFLF